VPRLINYQGRITDKSGTPLNGASFTLVFGIYDAKASGNLFWQGTYSNVTITKGVFNILLGDVNDPGYNFETLAFDKPYWLQIKVGSDVMAPRQQIFSSGYAIRAERAEQANNADTISNVGVNTAPTPNKLLPLDGNGKLPSAQGLLGNNIVVLTGTISNGGTIPLPTGYTQNQCKWMACLGRIAWNDDQHATEFDIGVSVDANRVVTVHDYRHGTEHGQSYATYIIIGIK